MRVRIIWHNNLLAFWQKMKQPRFMAGLLRYKDVHDANVMGTRMTRAGRVIRPARRELQEQLREQRQEQERARQRR